MADFLRFPELESTNDELVRRAHEGAPDGLWIMADRQTRGRGRQGRDWMSAANGNLYCSGLIRLQGHEPPPQQLSFVAALAVRDVLQPLLPEIGLKWPNDLLVRGRKISGILLESGGHAAGGRWIVVGIGINLAAHPADETRPATDVQAECGIRPEPAEVLQELAARMAAWRTRWQQEGFAPVRAAWLAHCVGLGRPLLARFGQNELSGVFVNLAEDGALELRLDSGEVRAIHAGEIFGI